MSPSNFVDTLDPKPAPSVARLLELVLSTAVPASLEAGDDPMAIAERANLPVVETMAALGALLKAHMGNFFVRVVNSDGETLREYQTLDEVEPVILDKFDIEHRVEPDQTRVLFRAEPALLKYVSGVR